MQLISSPTSPFVRKVRVLIHEAGKTDTVELVNVSTTPVSTDPRILPANPLGKIPALIRPEGAALYDSRVITRYLDTLWSLGLYPEATIWDTLTLEASADAMMEAAVLMVYESRVRPQDLAYAPWVEAQWGKVSRALDALEATWMDHLSGPTTAAHIAVGCALSYIDFRHADRAWRAARPDLAAWHAVWADRESMQLTTPS